MISLQNLRIGAKLGAAFLIVLLLNAAVGAFAVLKLASINANTEDIATNWLPSIIAAQEMRSASNDFRRVEARLVLAADDAARAPILKQLDELAQTAQKRQAVYEPLISLDAERAAYEDYKKAIATYMATHARLAALLREPGKHEQAVAVYVNDSKVSFNDALAALNKIVELNGRGGEDAHQAAKKSYAEAKTIVIALVLVSISIGAVLATWITRQITRPIGAAVDSARRIADGDLTGRIEVVGRDESAQLLQALALMKDNLAHIVQDVRGNSESVATASAQIAQGNLDLSQRTEQQASALEETAASMEQLGSTVRQNADNARQADQLARSASTVAVRGGDVVGKVVETMKGINESSSRIADIISVIDGIAFQTNILALNAAVEAARAGEQGRGFAVVAGEVRTLAQRSADAAKEIKGLITTSVERVQQGATLVDEAGVTMAEIVGSIQRVTDIMSEISVASSEQSTGVGQVGEAVAQMDQVTQQNAALVEESAAAAESLKGQAQQLVQAVSIFKLQAVPAV